MAASHRWRAAEAFYCYSHTSNRALASAATESPQSYTPNTERLLAEALISSTARALMNRGIGFEIKQVLRRE